MVPGNEQIAVLNLHARNDNVVPPGGGQSSDGWFFESVNTLMAQWGSYNSCSGALPPYCSSASPPQVAVAEHAQQDVLSHHPSSVAPVLENSTSLRSAAWSVYMELESACVCTILCRW